MVALHGPVTSGDPEFAGLADADTIPAMLSTAPSFFRVSLVFGAALVVACFESVPSGAGDTDGEMTGGDVVGTDGAETDGHPACVPGMTIDCACPGGAMGAQTCRADGSGYDACDCGGADTTTGDPDPDTTGESSSGGLDCEASEIACDGQCIDPQSSVDWCGASGDCVGENAGSACVDVQSCVNGECSCPDGLVLCNGECVIPPTGDQVFSFTASPSTFDVPSCVHHITIEAFGAQGGGSVGGGGGLGAHVVGEFDVDPGVAFTVIVGEMGHLQIDGSDQNSSGGGGGSFVYAGDDLLVAAGGGGGRCNFSGAVALHAGAHGQAGEDGGNDSSGQFVGGMAGAGGSMGQWSGEPDAGGGAGWLSPGESQFGGHNATGGWAGGDPFCGGGGGGCGGFGGFGGGGGGGNHYGGGGGGGGYSGGAGGGDPDHGGGGGSFNAGANASNAGGVRTGHGEVIISW
jgi:hypothetical protein